MAGLTYCLSVIGEGSSPAQINQQINTSNNQISNVSNIVATSPLTNFGPNNGEWCADQVCFESIPDVDQICAIVIHECESGKIIDWQSPVMGHSCPDGYLCIDIACFKIQGTCSEPKSFDVDLACADPCEVYRMIRNTRLKLMMQPFLVSWKNADKSENYCKPNIEDMKCLESEYRQLCSDRNCDNKSMIMPYRAPRPC